MAGPVFGRMGRRGGDRTGGAGATSPAAVAAERTVRVARLDPDRRLVVAAQADPARFEALYRKYVAQVYSFALYELRDHHEAEDVTERTFMLALSGLSSFEERADPADGDASTFRIWLFRIARNAVANHKRSARRRPVAPLEAAAGLADPFDVSHAAAGRDEARAAWEAVGRLPDDRRRAIVLRFVEEMSAAEIAGVLGRTEGAVRVLLHRALRSVAADLRRIDAARDDGRNTRDADARDADARDADARDDGRGRPEGSR
jgi:RNA polymerase sigma-70 factor (ECF subfamily)